MRQHIFGGSRFSPVLGGRNRIPMRRLGFTPTGATPPADCTPLGTRMIEEQGGYTPIGCPVNADCHDIVDAVTGQVVIAKVKGPVPWVEPCAKFGYQRPGGAPSQASPQCPDMGWQAWNDLVAKNQAEWEASGKTILREACAIVESGTGAKEFTRECWFPDEQIARTGMRSGNVEQGLASYESCEAAWARICAMPENASRKGCKPAEPQTIPAPGPTTPVTVLPPPAAGFQQGCNPPRGLAQAPALDSDVTRYATAAALVAGLGILAHLLSSE